jgi:hypothetical protein
MSKTFVRALSPPTRIGSKRFALARILNRPSYPGDEINRLGAPREASQLPDVDGPVQIRLAQVDVFSEERAIQVASGLWSRPFGSARSS